MIVAHNHRHRACPPSDKPDKGAGLVVYRYGGGTDAIAEYSHHLVDALCGLGVPASYTSEGLQPAKDARAKPAWVLLQYNPLSYGRWGFAPRLIDRAIAIRRQTGVPFVVLVHEPWVDVLDWRSALMSGYHRAQLWSLLAVADRVIATTERIANLLGKHAVHLAVGANVMPTAATAAEARMRLGLGDALVVSLFGRGHPTRALDYAEEALVRLYALQEGLDLVVLNLGDLAPLFPVPHGIEVRNTGRLERDDLSLALRATDLLLLPLSDGVSTRRTTLMAGLAHGIPIVGLDGRNTDRILREHPEALVLTPMGDHGAFADAVAELSLNRPRRRALGEAGRRLYLDEFDWPVLAERVHAVVSGRS